MLATKNRSERTQRQRLARRQGVQGFDRGGSRRSLFKSRYAKIFYAVGLVGILGSLIPLLILGNGQDGVAREGGRAPVDRAAAAAAPPPAVAQPQFDAPPAMILDPALDYSAVIQVEGGDVQVDLLEDAAPLHVNNFVFLAGQGWYDGLTWHRVVDGELAQAGDPTGLGSGGAGYLLPPEPASAGTTAALSLDGEGLVSMARSEQGTSSAQFFVTLRPRPDLDALGFTTFGRVTAGLELLRALPPRNPLDVPAPPAGAPILSIRIFATDPATGQTSELDTRAAAAASGERAGAATSDNASADSTPTDE